ncbi:50S ribosomal protein L23 [Thermodesulfovibrio yellowstonii]|uniref:Large ribosomal subunit protein uL23 n=1 Tax=Thermodesulfovibrio yellowstonii TaxID=28262 RepID=A0A9W6GG09_9BACT|nr:50S ribosomal protein L23 [Thermodesulfovibrio islandicus]GLI53166.1 50S ribosomal protein L23 [Thermodesulfovibrio islandicus]
MDIYSIIKKPVFTEKALNLKESQNKVVIEVHPDVNKVQVKKAFEEIFKVKVDSVGIINVKPKIKRVGLHFTKTKKTKKAIVTLKAGEKLDLIEGV